MTELLKLHLGCGRTRYDGWLNVDLYPAPNVDAAFDVQKTWPVADNSAAHIYASHLLEHLADPHAFFEEAWRVLAPSGSMLLRLPYGGHRAAWWDLTHLRPWFAETFAALQPGYAAAVGNPQGEAWRAFFGVTVDLRISGKFARLIRWRLGRRWLVRWAANIQDCIEELWVRCWPLKTSSAIEEYRARHPANCVAAQYVIYRHHLERCELRAGEGTELVPLASVEAVNGFHGWR